MDARLYLSQQAKNNPQETLLTLQTAADEVFSESTQNLDEMRKKAWYKRLWELITFSRNNQKALAISVDSLAKLQEIVVKALLVLSVQNTELSGDVLSLTESHQLLSEQVERIAKTQYKLTNRMIEWKYGRKRGLLISELREPKKTAIFGIYTSFVKENHRYDSKYGKSFSAALCKAFGNATPEKRDDSLLDELFSFDEQELLFKLLQSWLYLSTGDFGDQGIFDRFAISTKRKKELCESICDAIEMQGEENYIDWYATQEALNEDDVNAIDDAEIVFEKSEISLYHHYIDFEDETIRTVVAQYDSCFGAKKFDIGDPKDHENIVKRIRKVNPAIALEAVVGVYKSHDVVLTTHAMYTNEKKFVFSALNEDNLALGAIGGEKYRLTLPQEDGTNVTLQSYADITKLKELLLSLAKLKTAPTDESVPFDKLPYEKRKAFYSLLFYIIVDSHLPVFDTYAKIAELEKEQEENVFEMIVNQGISLPVDISEYRDRVADFFESVPYPSQQTVSKWAMVTVLETLSLTKWSNAVSEKEKNLVFCMDYAGICGDESQKHRLLDDTTLEPYFIDDKLTDERLRFFFKHSEFLTNKFLSGAAAFLTAGGSLFVQRKRADNMRKNLIRDLLDTYNIINEVVFSGESNPVGLTENEREKFDERISTLSNKL